MTLGSNHTPSIVTMTSQAVPAGQVLLQAHWGGEVDHPVVLLNPDGGSVQIYPLERKTRSGEQWCWECMLSLSEPGLYFYHYEDGGHRLAPAQGDWQLTVYAPDFSSPDWCAGGVMYQIFPDRFSASGQPKQGVPKDRYHQSDWLAQPAYEQGESGRVLGNDYYGGDLRGIEQRLDYLASLGVTCLYLNPIFEAHSNHRYNTADYEKIDPLLGVKEDFVSLCRECHRRGMRVILDGVFSHTGSDSRYFNAKGRYSQPGAAQSIDSPWFSWYSFSRYPDQYAAWWGVPTLPEVREEENSFLEYITGENGIARLWLRLGADGWRLDVADELPDGFLERLRAAVKAEKPDALLLGEVWEDATTKVSYGHRRRYLLGSQLDSVMNYPWREAILAFVRGGSAEALWDAVDTLLRRYPPPAVQALMNHLGTHDTARLITELAGDPGRDKPRDWQAKAFLDGPALERGRRRVRMAAAIQYTLPGVPCLYYGDEIGMPGCGDPFNRAAYDWQGGDRQLRDWYRLLGRLRALCPALRAADMLPVRFQAGHAAYVRRAGENALLVAVNRWCDGESLELPIGWERAVALAGPVPANGRLWVPSEEVCLLGVGPWVERWE